MNEGIKMNIDTIIGSNDFLISREKNEKYKNHYDIGDYKFQYNDSNAIKGTVDDKMIIVYGTIVNSKNYNHDNNVIIGELLESKDFTDLIERSKKMAGRYIIVYNSSEGLFILPDSISSIQVAYTVLGCDLYVASNPKTIGDINGFEESIISKAIKSSADETHPLPYDVSMYDEVKFVIPNHFLNCESRKTTRYYPLIKVKETSAKTAALISSEIISNTIRGYLSKYKLSIPLTSGLDSRTILSICKNYMSEIPTYTFFHDNFNDDTSDIVIPKEISKQHSFRHIVLEDLDLPNELIEVYKNKFGNSIVKSEARNAWTYYNSPLYEYCRLDGNISLLAKSNFGRNLPEYFAKPSYLVTKTHNYSKFNYKEVIKWCNNVDEYTQNSGISKYDLFFWEHRAGKWTTNSMMNSDLLIKSLNPFNCRELIETWLSVPKRNRINGEIHKEIISINWPELLEFPINPGSKYSIVYKNSFLFYIASIVKYLHMRNKY